MAKNIVVCLDGTWDTEHHHLAEDSNVARLYDAATKTANQVTRYVKGVGTDWYDKLRGGAFGYGLSERIQEGYNFIIESFLPGDKIFLFGFSRGAFSARSLGGLIGTAGILKPERRDLSDAAYEVYRSQKPDDQGNVKNADVAKHFRDTYSYQDRTIELIGVWDTVGALGLPGFLDVLDPYPHRFHNTQLGAHVRAGIHALAIDEQRGDFKPTLWTGGPSAPGQVIEQVWFAGVHSDVGGGYADDNGLADITLRWMADRAAKRGLLLDATKLPAAPNCYAKLHDSLTPLFRLRPRYQRPITSADPVHTTVKDRLAGTQPAKPRPYAPTNMPKSATYIP